MFNGIKKIGYIIWGSITAVFTVIAGIIICKSNKETELLDKKTKEEIVNNAIVTSGLYDSITGLKTSVNDLINENNELYKYKELVKKSTDTTLSPEENFQASIELARSAGVPENEIIKTPEEGKRYFTE